MESDSNYPLYIQGSKLIDVLEKLLRKMYEYDLFEYISKEEVVVEFKKIFKEVDEDWWGVNSEEEFIVFLTFLGKMAIGRCLSQMVKEGVVDYLHDGEDFVYKLSEQ